MAASLVARPEIKAMAAPVIRIEARAVRLTGAHGRWRPGRVVRPICQPLSAGPGQPAGGGCAP